MSDLLLDVDPMTTQWRTYEDTLRAQYASLNLPAEKLNYIMSEVRDAYLRSAPTFDKIPPCPNEVHLYVFGVTLRLLGQVARQVAEIYDTNQLLAQGLAMSQAMLADTAKGTAAIDADRALAAIILSTQAPQR